MRLIKNLERKPLYIFIHIAIFCKIQHLHVFKSQISQQCKIMKNMHNKIPLFHPILFTFSTEYYSYLLILFNKHMFYESEFLKGCVYSLISTIQ